MQIFEFGPALLTWLRERTARVFSDVFVHHPVEAVSHLEVSIITDY